VNRFEKQSLTFISFSAIVVLGMAIAPWVYNFYLFPLAKLKNSIEIGESYEVVKQRFDQYYKQFERESDIQYFADPDTLFLYHVNIFDDCQLTVTFADDSGVAQVSYIGD
jgi:hypothetical protein